MDDKEWCGRPSTCRTEEKIVQEDQMSVQMIAEAWTLTKTLNGKFAWGSQHETNLCQDDASGSHTRAKRTPQGNLCWHATATWCWSQLFEKIIICYETWIVQYDNALENTVKPSPNSKPCSLCFLMWRVLFWKNGWNGIIIKIFRQSWKSQKKLWELWKNDMILSYHNCNFKGITFLFL